MVLIRIKRPGAPAPARKTFLELVTEISPAILTRVTLYTVLQLWNPKTSIYSKPAKFAADGEMTEAVAKKLETLGGLHGIRADLQVSPVDPANDSSRLFRITEYSGYTEDYVANGQEIIDAVAMAYGNTLTTTKAYLPSEFRLSILSSSIIMHLRNAFKKSTATYLDKILSKFHIEKIEDLRIDYYFFILDAIPECKAALGIKSGRCPYGVLGRLSLVPYLVDGAAELSAGMDVTMLLLMVYDALHMVGDVLGDRSAIARLNELAGHIMAFKYNGSLTGLRVFYDYGEPVAC